MTCDSDHPTWLLHFSITGLERTFNPTGTMRYLRVFFRGVCEGNNHSSCLPDLKLRTILLSHGVENFKLTKKKKKLSQNMITIVVINLSPQIYHSWSPTYLSLINSLFCLSLFEFSVTYYWHRLPETKLYKDLLWLLSTAKTISNKKHEKRLCGWYLCWC